MDRVNLDDYAAPPSDPASLAERREALLDQLGWLADEADALAPLLAPLPAWALEQKPLADERSVKETLAYLAALDRDAYPRWLDQLATEEAPALAPAEAPTDVEANAQPLDALIADLRAARTAFLARIEAVPEAVWSTAATLDGASVTLYDLALRIVRHDADALRALAYRLHEAKLSPRA